MSWSAVKLYKNFSFFDFLDKSNPYIKFLEIINLCEPQQILSGARFTLVNLKVNYFGSL